MRDRKKIAEAKIRAEEEMAIELENRRKAKAEGERARRKREEREAEERQKAEEEEAWALKLEKLVGTACGPDNSRGKGGKGGKNPGTNPAVKRKKIFDEIVSHRWITAVLVLVHSTYACTVLSVIE